LSFPFRTAALVTVPFAALVTVPFAIRILEIIVLIDLAKAVSAIVFNLHVRLRQPLSQIHASDSFRPCTTAEVAESELFPYLVRNDVGLRPGEKVL
jgi:hypothetical protein